MFMARLTTDGSHIWSKGNTAAGEPGSTSVDCFGIAEAPDGKIVVGIVAAGKLDFGLGPITTFSRTMLVLQMNGL